MGRLWQGTLREAENRARVRLAMVAVKIALVVAAVLVEVVGKEKVQRARSSGLRWSPCCRRESSGIDRDFRVAQRRLLHQTS